MRNFQDSKTKLICLAVIPLVFSACGPNPSDLSQNTALNSGIPVTASNVLALTSAQTTVARGGAVQFTATGGKAPYTYFFSRGPGDAAMNSQTGVLTVGQTVGLVTVGVTDALKATSYATISVVPPTTSVVVTQASFAAGQLLLNGGQTTPIPSLGILSYQTDGNLAVYNSAGTVLWSSVSGSMNCAAGCTASFQSDGNLVLSQNGTAYWASNTSAVGKTLVLSAIAPYIQVMNAGSTSTYWTSATPSGLHSGLIYAPGALVFNGPNQQVSMTNARLIFLSDGNLAIYNNAGASLWSTGLPARDCSSGCQAVFQGDGNLVLYQNGNYYWQSNTSGVGKNIYLRDSVPYLQIANAVGQSSWYSH